MSDKTVVTIWYNTEKGREIFEVNGREVSREEVLKIFKSGKISELWLEYGVPLPIDRKGYIFGDKVVKVVKSIYMPHVRQRDEFVYYIEDKNLIGFEIDKIIDILEIENLEERRNKLKNYLYNRIHEYERKIRDVFG